MTLTEITAAIAAILHRDDLTDSIPRWIVFAEAEFDRRLRTQWQICIAESEPVEGQNRYGLPQDFAQMDGLYVGSERVSYLPPDPYQAYVSSNPGGSDCFVYTITGREFEISPTPASTMKLVYYRMLSKLAEANPSNWLSQNFPDLYVYGALKHSAPDLYSDARLPIWEKLFEDAIQSLILSDEEARYAGKGQSMRVRVG